MGAYSRVYSLSDGTTAYGSQVAFELDALGSSVNNIVNAQIAAGAAIVDSKLAQITTASKVSVSALTGDYFSTHYREGLHCVQASSTTMTVGVGSIEVGGVSVSKTSATTLTITTAGNWAGGVSLQGTSDYGFIGIDISGNVKMHTTAPSHSNFGVSVTAGTKRYATWSSTVYRIIGWFYMNSTGAGELNAWEVSNLKEKGAPMHVVQEGSDDISTASTSLADMANTTIYFYSTGRPVRMSFRAPIKNSGDGNDSSAAVYVDSSSEMLMGSSQAKNAGTDSISLIYDELLAEGEHMIKIQWKTSAGTVSQEGSSTGIRQTTVEEL